MSNGVVLLPTKSMSVANAKVIAKQIADEMGYELVDTELVKEPAGRFLRFYVSKGDSVTLDDLEAFHRRIQPLVEEVDFDYMEVSSPGADRPLKTERDFARAQGSAVELHTYKPVNGAKKFVGELVKRDGDNVYLSINGEEIVFAKKDVSIVKPYIELEIEELLNGD